ncbi:MAG: multicopper oxidase family protein [Patescibacteria group bacterium]
MKKNYILVAIIVVIFASFSLLSSENSEREFSTSTRALPLAISTHVVDLKDGDTIDLTASFVKKNINGKEVRMLAYNGSIPGPTIKVSQGATIIVNFKNDTDIANTLHSHGVRMKNEFDGVPDVTQKIVPIGGSFAYTLSFPDAGAYWYHPHVRDDYAIEMGLYGNFLVTPKAGSSWNLVDREVPIFVDDILLTNGKIAPFKKDGADRTLMGRYGNTMFVNGETDYSLNVKRGEVVRFYFTNSANTRPFNIAIKNAKLKLVGGDSGLYERDSWVDAVMINPSERAIVEVLFGTAGEYVLQNKTPDKTYTLGKIVVSGEQVVSEIGRSFSTLRAHPEVIKSIDQFRTSFNSPHQRRIKLSVDMMGGSGTTVGHMMPGGTMMAGNMSMNAGIPKGGIEWEDTDMSAKNMMSDTRMVKWNITDEDTGKKNMDIDWSFKRGPVKIRITNDASSMHPMQHPIHFHGQRFLVTNKNGVSQTNLVWKDTLLVPAGEYVDIILDASNPGTWMAHCHILEHIEAGMMFAFNVE